MERGKDPNKVKREEESVGGGDAKRRKAKREEESWKRVERQKEEEEQEPLRLQSNDQQSIAGSRKPACRLSSSGCYAWRLEVVSGAPPNRTNSKGKTRGRSQQPILPIPSQPARPSPTSSFFVATDRPGNHTGKDLLSWLVALAVGQGCSLRPLPPPASSSRSPRKEPPTAGILCWFNSAAGNDTAAQKTQSGSNPCPRWSSTGAG